MTHVKFGQYTATLNGSTWSSDEPAVEKLLQDTTALIQIGAHVPDVEQFIVIQLQKILPAVQVIESDPPPPREDLPGVLY